MAISKTHYEILKGLYQRGALPQGGSLLQIGEPNFYGDFPLSEAIEEYDGQFGELEWLDSFVAARLIVEALFNPSRVVSIDLHGPTAIRANLNGPISLGMKFDAVVNHGTLEHIFNISQAFKTIHDHCWPGGLMIHESPFQGWIDHGFVCFQPTLFFDLAAANDYQIELMAIEELSTQTVTYLENREHLLSLAESGQLSPNPMLFVVFRKQHDRAFRIPMQGYYANSLSAEAKQAWKALR